MTNQLGEKGHLSIERRNEMRATTHKAIAQAKCQNCGTVLDNQDSNFCTLACHDEWRDRN